MIQRFQILMMFFLVSLTVLRLNLTKNGHTWNTLHLFIYLGFYVAFNTVQVISRWVVGRAEETST